MNSNTYSLAAPEILHITDASGRIWLGCDQEWFGSYWQRLAGCGPCVASNILMYLYKRNSINLPYEIANKDDFIRLMEVAWRHVTPTAKGLNTPELMRRGMEGFARAHGFKLACFTLNMPKEKKERPTLAEMADFIKEGLLKDSPVAFLNLSNGAVHNLDSWHWVTIVSIVIDAEKRSVFAKAYDGAEEILVDLKLWYETTSLGGGFVYLQAADNERAL